MSASLNKAQILGNLGQDPDVRSMRNGDKVASLSIATSVSWKDDEGERQERTEWHRVVIFGPLAEVAEKYLEKGSKVYVEGELRTRKWTKDNVDRYTTEIVLSGFNSVMKMLGGPKGDGGGGSEQAETNRGYSADLDDEIPF